MASPDDVVSVEPIYRIQLPGLGFVHKSWKDDEPRFCTLSSKAKGWKTLAAALEFGNQKLTPRGIKLRWELWQEVSGTWIPVIRRQT